MRLRHGLGLGLRLRPKGAALDSGGEGVPAWCACVPSSVGSSVLSVR